MLALVMFLFIIIYFLYKYLSANYEYWKKRGVEHPEVSLFFGNLFDVVTTKKSLGQTYTDIYNKYKNIPYVGFYKVRQPGIIIRDPDLVKKILVQDFSSFHENDAKLDEKADPELARNPFFLQGSKWKNARTQLGASFSSGKMKTIFPHMVDVSKQLVSYIEKECLSDGDGTETKELSAKFTTDNVASCAFGIQGKSFEDPKAEFREMGRKMLNPSFFAAIKFMCMFLFPWLTKFVCIRFVPRDVASYWNNMVKDTLKFRREKNLVRNDFLDLMNQLKVKSSAYEFTDDDIVAHAMSFFIDGFETSSVTLSFTLYDLAANEDIQERLKCEIDTILAKYEGRFTYEATQEMSLLDCVISESLRLHPPAMFIGKLCTEDYILPKNGTNLKIEVGTPIVIPVYGLHHDENYYPDPEKFDPNRFSEKNRSNIVKGTYLPFGEGPRVCIGQRFALLQVKIAVASIIKDFRIRLNKKSMGPLEIDPKYFLLAAKDGLWLDYQKRI